MSSASDFHDQDFDALEAQLDNLPPARQSTPYIIRPFAFWLASRKLAREKKRHGEAFSKEVTVDLRQTLGSSGGWISFGSLEPKTIRRTEQLIAEKLAPRGLAVSDFTIGFAGMYDGPEGTFQSLRAHFRVT